MGCLALKKSMMDEEGEGEGSEGGMGEGLNMTAAPPPLSCDVLTNDRIRGALRTA